LSEGIVCDEDQLVEPKELVLVVCRFYETLSRVKSFWTDFCPSNRDQSFICRQIFYGFFCPGYLRSYVS
jgi:hypothetical protein